MIRTTFAVFLFFFLYSCETDTTVNLPQLPPALVIHGYIQTGDSVKITVSRTAKFDEPVTLGSANVVSYALVQLFENGVLKDTLKYNFTERMYKSSKVVAIPGNTYRVVVHAPDFTTVEATSIAPAVVNSVGVTFRRHVRFDVDGNSLDDISFRFSDPVNEKNFYLASLADSYPGITYRYFCVYSYDAVIEQYQNTTSPFETGNCISNNEILFTDRSFNGELKEIKISGQSNSLDSLNDGMRIYRPYLAKYNITEDYYKYIKARISLNALADNPFAEPVITAGNVKNGYGIFTIFSATTDTLR